MTSLREQKEMLEYIVDKLERGSMNVNVTPKNRRIVGNKSTNYIQIGDDGLVILVDKKYTEEGFRTLCRELTKGRKDAAVVFYKDGETFFRSAAQANYFKKEHSLSLKHYTSEQMTKMMLLSPEERFIQERRTSLQYYQPDSANLERGIETFRFEPVRFDYSHISSYEKFKPQDADSKRLFIWTERTHEPENLKLEDNRLMQL